MFCERATVFFVLLSLKKKRLMKYFCTLLFLVLASATVQAQDKIFRKNGKVVEAKVIEIGTSEIKYRIYGQDDGPIYVLEKDRITRIQFENGTVEKITPDFTDPEAYADQKNKVLKVDFLGPLLGYSQIGFEKSTGVGKSYEITLGIIGAGKNQRYNFNWYMNDVVLEKRSQLGLAIGVGYKFNKWPNYLFGKARMTHLMQGAYIKPNFYIGHYAEDRIADKGNNQYVVERQKITFGALQIEMGKQWVFAEQFALDFYGGLGYGADNKKTDGPFGDSYSAYNYINSRGGQSPGVSLTWGVKIGYLLK
jgi:hypothetical protein